MPTIPILKIREDDELFYSYILRISAANGFQAVNEFAATYLWPNADIEYKKAKKLRKDGFFDWNMFLKTIDIDINVPEFFKETTLYSGIAPFMRKEQQVYIINIAFRSDTAFFTNPSVCVVQRLKSCPECRKQEIESKGYFWFRRTHQMPGIKKCHIHGCDLQICNSPQWGKELEEPIFTKINPKEEVVSEVGYSYFVSQLLNIGLDVDFKDILNSIYKKLVCLGYAPGKKGIYDFIESIQCSSGRGHILNNQVWESLKYGSMVSSRGKPLYRMVLVYLLFGSVEELISSLPDCNEIDFDFLNSITGYEVYKPYHRNLVMMKHMECESTFLTTPYGFITGFDCPYCNCKRSEKERIKRMMNKTLGSSYELEGLEFNANHKVNKIRFKHASCGKVHSLKPSDIFYEGTRCECERRIPFKEIVQRVQECGDYEVVSFKNVNEDMFVRHIECGKIFNVNYYELLKNPYCRVCFKEGADIRWKNTRTYGTLTEEVFKNVLKNMIGNEYMLDGEYTNGGTHVSIRHSICGQSKMYKPNIFTQGLRCNCNNLKLSYTSFVKLVSECSYGKYNIIGYERKCYYTILNTETGSTFQMTKNMILQELYRLDGSPVLPLKEIKDVDKSAIIEKTQKESLLSYIQKHFDKGKTFPATDLGIFISDVNKRSRILSQLVNQKLLIRTRVGFFKLPDNGEVLQDVLPETIIRKEFEGRETIIERYLFINGCHTGYLYGKSLAYELGILTDEPDKLYIATNVRTAKKLNRTTGKHGSIQIIFYKPFANVCNENFIILSIIDYLYSYPNYRQKYHGERILGEYALLKEYLIKNKIQINDFEKYLEGFQEENQLKNEILRVYTAGQFVESVIDKQAVEKLFIYLKKHFKEHEIIYSANVHLDGSNRDISQLSRHLVKKGFLRRVGKRGSYVFASYYKTDESIAEAIYIKGLNGYNGYLYGKSFMYEIGLIPEKPERLYYCTNLFSENVALRRNKTVGDVTIVIRKPIIRVTEHNRRVLPLIDFLLLYSDPYCRSKKMSEQAYICLRKYVNKHNLSKSDFIKCLNDIGNKELLLSELEILYERLL